MKILNTVLRVVLVLLMISPILGALGIGPAPTADMYNTPEAFAFIDMLMDSKYVTWVMAIVFTIAIVLTITNRMAAAALLILPITINIIGFHAFLDGGLFTAGASMGVAIFLINLYFLWQNRATYRAFLRKNA